MFLNHFLVSFRTSRQKNEKCRKRFHFNNISNDRPLRGQAPLKLQSVEKQYRMPCCNLYCILVHRGKFGVPQCSHTPRTHGVGLNYRITVPKTARHTHTHTHTHTHLEQAEDAPTPPPAVIEGNSWGRWCSRCNMRLHLLGSLAQRRL
jgi:hypothetical protein